MKTILTVFLFIGSILCLTAQDEKITCPFEMENGRIILQYPENGQTLRLRLSSIEGLCLISCQAADRLNYKYEVGKDSIPIFGYFFQLYPFKQKTDKFLFVSDFSHVEELKNVDGFLGRLFLESNVVNLDFKNKEVSITKAVEENLVGKKIDTLQLQIASSWGGRLYYTLGAIEYGQKKDLACLVLNIVDVPVQAQIQASVFDNEPGLPITILGPSPFRGKIEGSKILHNLACYKPDKSMVYLGLDYVKKYKNVILDYPNRRILLVE